MQEPVETLLMEEVSHYLTFLSTVCKYGPEFIREIEENNLIPTLLFIVEKFDAKS